MVWAAVTADVRCVTKFKATYYQENILEAALKPWTRKYFGQRRTWTFQQDSVLSHKVCGNKKWLKNNVPKLISSTQWFSNLSNANPINFFIWSILVSQVRTKKHVSINALKEALKREWCKIPQDRIRAAYDSFLDHLWTIVKEKGGQIEPK